MEWRFVHVLFLALVQVVCSVAAMAQVLKPTENMMDIYLEDQTQNTGGRGSAKLLCKNLSSGLMFNRGFWRTGLASGARCYWNGSFVAGKEGFDARYQLRLYRESGLWHINLIDLSFASAAPLAGVSLVNSSNVFRAFSDPRITKLIGAYLLDSAPFLKPIDPGTGSTGIRVGGVPGLRVPKKLAVFNLHYDGTMFLPTVIGFANPGGKIEFNDPLYSRGKIAYVHFGRGSGLQRKPLTRMLNGMLKKYGSEIRQSNILPSFLPGGFSGVKVGIPMSADHPLIEKSQVISILAEARSGFLDGLRWHWDFATESQNTDGDLTETFTWSRAGLGWAFAFPLDFLTVGNSVFEMDATPKIGTMDMDTKLLVENLDGSKSVAEFRVKNAFSVGFEVGITWSNPWLLLRTWGASDLAGISGLLDDETTITSLRGGLDSYVDLFSLGDIFDFTLLTFVAAENITIEKQSTEVLTDLDEGSTGIDSVSFTSFFLGLGGTVKW